MNMLTILTVIITILVIISVMFGVWLTRNLVSFMGDSEKLTKKLVERRTSEENQGAFDEYEDEDDYKDIIQNIETGISQDREITQLLNMDKYKLKGDKIEIFPSLQATLILPHEEVYVEGVTKKMQVVEHRGKKGIVIKERLASITVMLVPSVLVDELGFYEGLKMFKLNHKMYVNKQINTNNFSVTHITRQSYADITTITSDGRFLKIGAKVTKTVNVPVVVKNKPKIATIAIIIPLLSDQECCWIGSVVICNKAMFAVTEVIRYNAPDIIKLVCMAMIPTALEIVVVEKDETK